MNRFRKLLALIPVIIAFLVCDKTWTDFAAMMIGGLILWIPYWLAWWLSNGFNIFNTPSNFGDEDDDNYFGYRNGSQGYGYYAGNKRIHH